MKTSELIVLKKKLSTGIVPERKDTTKLVEDVFMKYNSIRLNDLCSHVVKGLKKSEDPNFHDYAFTFFSSVADLEKKLFESGTSMAIIDGRHMHDLLRIASGLKGKDKEQAMLDCLFLNQHFKSMGDREFRKGKEEGDLTDAIMLAYMRGLGPTTILERHGLMFDPVDIMSQLFSVAAATHREDYAKEVMDNAKKMISFEYDDFRERVRDKLISLSSVLPDESKSEMKRIAESQGIRIEKQASKI